MQFQTIPARCLVPGDHLLKVGDDYDLPTPTTVTSIAESSLLQVTINDRFVVDRDADVDIWTDSDKPCSWIVYGAYAGDPTIGIYDSWTDAYDAVESMTGAPMTDVQVARVTGIRYDDVSGENSKWEVVDY